MDECFRDFSRLPFSREEMRAVRNDLRRIDAGIIKVTKMLEAVHRRSSVKLLAIGADDQTVLEIFRRRRIWPRIEACNMLLRSVAGTRDEARDWLYWRILSIWTYCLGGKLKVSNPPKEQGEPYGPLVRFFDAAVRPLLGDKTPGRHAIRKIVRQERQRRIEQERHWQRMIEPKGTLPPQK
jgi:hypothetical protein